MSESGEASLLVYLSGPEIYHPRALKIAANKISVCERYGLAGVSPLDLEGGRPHSGMVGEELTDDEDLGALLERLLANGHDITRFRIEARLNHY